MDRQASGWISTINYDTLMNYRGGCKYISRNMDYPCHIRQEPLLPLSLTQNKKCPYGKEPCIRMRNDDSGETFCIRKPIACKSCSDQFDEGAITTNLDDILPNSRRNRFFGKNKSYTCVDDDDHCNECCKTLGKLINQQSEPNEESKFCKNPTCKWKLMWHSWQNDETDKKDVITAVTKKDPTPKMEIRKNQGLKLLKGDKAKDKDLRGENREGLSIQVKPVKPPRGKKLSSKIKENHKSIDKENDKVSIQVAKENEEVKKNMKLDEEREKKEQKERKALQKKKKEREAQEKKSKKEKDEKRKSEEKDKSQHRKTEQDEQKKEQKLLETQEKKDKKEREKQEQIEKKERQGQETRKKKEREEQEKREKKEKREQEKKETKEKVEQERRKKKESAEHNKEKEKREKQERKDREEKEKTEKKKREALEKKKTKEKTELEKRENAKEIADAEVTKKEAISIESKKEKQEKETTIIYQKKKKDKLIYMEQGRDKNNKETNIKKKVIFRKTKSEIPYGPIVSSPSVVKVIRTKKKDKTLFDAPPEVPEKQPEVAKIAPVTDFNIPNIVRLADVWKTCNKIRAAAYRVGLNLWDWYIPLDPEKNSLISESKFVSILAGPLRTVIGLSDKEIAQLADYFRTQDGRVLYAQMCEVIHGEDVPRPDTTELGDMLDARPPAPEPACHALGPEQTRRLRLLLAAIAARDLPLKPYFQDYELVAKSDGRITFAHFSRVLNYIGVLLSAADFGLLVRRFIKDAYTVDYVAFLLAVEEVAKNGIRGLGVDYMNPQLVMDTREDRPPSINLTRLSEPVARAPLDVRDIMLRVQRYVSQRQLRVSEFLRDYDPLNSGRITAQQFRRALDLMGLDWLQPREMLCLATQYTDPNDRDRVCWRTFEDDCDQVFTVKELEKHPTLALSSARAPPPPAARVRPAALDAAEAGLMRIKDKLRERSLDLRPIFRDYDMHNNGHISSSQLPRALARAALLLPRESLAALEECFCDDCGFYYVSFLDALGESFEQEAAPRELLPDLVQRFASARQGPPPEETDIVLILAKVKGKMVREGIRVLDFLSQFDLHKEQVIPRADFYRGLATSGLQLTPVEMDTLMEVFAAPNRRRYIEYARFASTVEEARTQSGLERAPLLTPVPHAPPPPAPHLDHEQRHRASVAMQKLARFPDRLSNVMEMFQDVDRENCGSIARTAFARVLQQRGAGSELSPRELELVCQCFGYERGCRNEVNYRAFVNALDLLYTVAKENPC